MNASESPAQLTPRDSSTKAPQFAPELSAKLFGAQNNGPEMTFHRNGVFLDFKPVFCFPRVSV